MKLPELLSGKGLIPLDIVVAEDIGVPVPGAPVVSGRVIIAYERVAQFQILSLWCWNAVGASLTQFHLDPNAASWIFQCKNASRHLEKAKECCTRVKVPGHPVLSTLVPYMRSGGKIAYDPSDPDCNQGWWPDAITHESGKLLSEWHGHPSTGPTPVQLNEVVKEIEKGRPVVMYIRWVDGSAHVQTLYGTHMAGGRRFFNVADPYDGPSVDVISNLAQPDGVWLWSMFTDRGQPPPLGTPPGPSGKPSET